MTADERRAQRRSTWKLLALGVVSNMIGCGVHYVIWPLRLGGAIPRPRRPDIVEELRVEPMKLRLPPVERGKP